VLLSYTYDAAGDLLTEHYPSGRTLSYSYDPIGRASGLSGTLGSTLTNYTSATLPISYAPHGGMRQATLGTSNSLIEVWGYNARLQPAGMSLGTTPTNASVRGLSFGYGSPNSGNLMTETISRSGLSGTLSQSYTYDTVNRISTASEGSAWSRGFGYDNYGNSWVNSASGIAASTFTPLSQSAYGVKNQLLSNGGGYDSGGNQTAMGSYAFTWDAENRMAATILGGATTNYLYDAEGRRVWKANCAGTGGCDPATAGSAGTWYVYDAEGQLAAEYGAVGSAPCTTCFLAVDHLGSTRVMTNASGTPVECHDYLPFGEAVGAGVNGRSGCYSGAADKGVLFTGQYRDGETQSSAMPSGLDYFGARYLSGAQGRFTSPDQPLVDQWEQDPQSWNLYAYVRNNPLLYRDLDGQACSRDGDGNFHGDCSSPGDEKVPQANQPQTLGVNDQTPSIVGPFFAAAVGHHGLPEWSKIPDSPAFQFFSRWFTGRLQNPQANYYDALHRSLNGAARDIVNKFLQQTGKSSLAELTKTEVKQLAQQLLDSKAQGVQEFMTRLEQLNPGATGTLRGLIDSMDFSSGFVFTVPGQRQLLNFQSCGGATCGSGPIF
jgi:RHS repeat-associated protein